MVRRREYSNPGHEHTIFAESVMVGGSADFDGVQAYAGRL